jgi:hypothetical protein
VTVQTPGLDHERRQLVIGDQIFEVSHQPKQCLFAATKRSEILAVLLGKDAE